MLELIVGFALGGLAFTDKGHEIGNKVYDIAIKAVKEVTKLEANTEDKRNDRG